MKQLNVPITRTLVISVVFILLLMTGYIFSHAEEKAAESKAVFYVTWYDVGEEALEGLQGVKRVERGFSGVEEINTVYFYPAQITIEVMEKALKDARTYKGRAK